MNVADLFRVNLERTAEAARKSKQLQEGRPYMLGILQAVIRTVTDTYDDRTLRSLMEEAYGSITGGSLFSPGSPALPAPAAQAGSKSLLGWVFGDQSLTPSYDLTEVEVDEEE